MKVFALLLLALFVSSASAVTPLSKRVEIPKSQVDDLIPVTMIGGESRKPLDAAGRKRHAATGHMDCRNRRVNVHLVGSPGEAPSVVITTSHHLYNADCNFLGSSDCKIYFPQSRNQKPYAIKEGTLRYPGCPKNGENRLDWSVFVLDRPVQAVEPYGIPQKGTTIEANTDVLTVAAVSRNIGSHHKQYCKLRERYRFARIPLQNDCDNIGSSGSGHFLVSQLPRLVLGAIMVNETTTYPEFSGAEYDGANHFNISVPLERDFLDAVYDSLDSVGKRRR